LAFLGITADLSMWIASSPWGPACYLDQAGWRWLSALFYKLTLGWRPRRALAQLVYFHSQGLVSVDAWREIVGRPRKA